MACDLWREKLDFYIDGELQPDEMERLLSHLKDCDSCSSDLISRAGLKRAVRAAANRYSPDPEFRKRIRNIMPAKRKKFWTGAWIPVFVACAAIIIVFLFGWQRRLAQEREHVFSELTDIHVATLASSNPMDVLSSDRHTVKPWFQGKIPFTFNLPDDPRFPLVGGRIAYLAQSPGAQLIFALGKHRVSVFVFQSQIGIAPRSGPFKHKTFNIESWTEDGLRWFAIGDANPDDIHNLSEILKRIAKATEVGVGPKEFFSSH